MKLYQVWFSMLVLPAFTEEQVAQYSSMISNFCSIGKQVNERELVRCLLPKEAIDTGQAWLTALGKNPIICDVRDAEGLRYGFELDTEGNVVATPGLTPYPLNEAEHDMYLIEGTSENTSAGWANWYDRL